MTPAARDRVDLDLELANIKNRIGGVSSVVTLRFRGMADTNNRRPWQFNLRGLLGVMAALAVLFALLASTEASTRFYGAVLIMPVLGGCIGFLWIGWAGVWPGVCMALMIEVLVVPIVLGIAF
jgi:hypothetical protein